MIEQNLCNHCAMMSNNFSPIIIPFIINLLVIGVITYGFYFRKTHRRDYLATFCLISITVFFLVSLLDNINLQIGFALGLFAVFGIIRYRTITIQIKEMTYLFVIITQRSIRTCYEPDYTIPKEISSCLDAVIERFNIICAK